MTDLTFPCRRCGTPYRVAASTVLPSCPKCGASPKRLVGFVRNNGVSAMLAVTACACLGVSMTMPFMTMTTMGQQRTFSLIGGIGQLWRDGYHILASVLLVFSVVFPFAKLVALLAATSGLLNLSNRTRRFLHRAADVSGKYSLLDVVVVAMLIVLIKFRGVAQVSAESGVIWFCAGVLLSIAASITARVDLAETSTIQPDGHNPTT
jgi:paraquat-inducible protein A